MPKARRSRPQGVLDADGDLGDQSVEFDSEEGGAVGARGSRDR